MTAISVAPSSSRPECITLIIKSAFSAETLCTVRAGRAWSVSDVQAYIERIEGTQNQLQRLLLNGRQLEDEEGLDAIIAQVFGASGSSTKNNYSVEVALVRVDRTWAATLQDVENGWVDLRDADESTKCNREIVTAAVRCDGAALQHASEKLKDDRGVVLVAVKSSGSALRFASPALRRDRDIVLAAVRGSALALRYASEELWQNREFTLAAVSMHGSSLVYAPELLRKDREVVLAAVRNDPSALQYAYPALQYDPEIQLVCRADGGKSDGDASRARRRPGWARLRCSAPHNRLHRCAPRSRVDYAHEPELLWYCE